MARRIILGCCGWSYFRPSAFHHMLKQPYGSLLQSYAQLFPAVEVNSTFYRIPRISTAEKWRKEVRDEFVFTVKAYRGITHEGRFGKKSLDYVESIKGIAETLNAPVVLFQSPASFTPTSANMTKAQAFFAHANRGCLTFAWEPRGSWFDNVTAIAELCEQHNLVVCVDPFRHEPIFFGEEGTAYFRLHGLGKQSMYRYTFSKGELETLASLINTLPQTVKTAYVFFNNVDCYENGLQFLDLLKE